MTKVPSLFLGASLPLDGEGASQRCRLPAHHLVTHGVVLSDNYISPTQTTT